MDDAEKELYDFMNGKKVSYVKLLEDDSIVRIYFLDESWVEFSVAGDDLNWLYADGRMKKDG